MQLLVERPAKSIPKSAAKGAKQKKEGRAGRGIESRPGPAARIMQQQDTPSDRLRSSDDRINVKVEATGPIQVRVEGNYVSKRIGAYRQRLARSGILTRLRSGSCQAVLDVLLDLLHAKGSAEVLLREDRMIIWPGAKMIQKRSGYARSQVHEGIVRLIKLGLLSRLKRGTAGRATVYEILWPPEDDSPDYWQSPAASVSGKPDTQRPENRTLNVRETGHSARAFPDTNRKIKESSDLNETAAERNADPSAAVVLNAEEEKAAAELRTIGVNGIEKLAEELGPWFTAPNVGPIVREAAHRRLAGKIKTDRGLRGWAVSECRRRAASAGQPTLFDTAVGRAELRDIVRKNATGEDGSHAFDGQKLKPTAAERGEYPEDLPLIVHRPDGSQSAGNSEITRVLRDESERIGQFPGEFPGLRLEGRSDDDYRIPERRPRRDPDTIGSVLAAAEPKPVESVVEQARRERGGLIRAQAAQRDADNIKRATQDATERERLAALPPADLAALEAAAMVRVDEALRPFIAKQGFEAAAGWRMEAIKLLNEGWLPPLTGGGA